MSDTIPLLRPQQRWFTPAEATALIPELLEAVTSLAEGIERSAQVAALLEEATDVQDRWAVQRDLEELQEATRESLSELEALGVTLKGLQPALLDFPAIRDGTEVYLCWREGEAEVSWWHPLHTGMHGRQLIDADPSSTWEYWS